MHDKTKTDTKINSIILRVRRLQNQVSVGIPGRIEIFTDELHVHLDQPRLKYVLV